MEKTHSLGKNLYQNLKENRIFFQFYKRDKIDWLIIYFIYNVSLFASSGVCEKINFTVSKLQKIRI
jgi:hypothetical protein